MGDVINGEVRARFGKGHKEVFLVYLGKVLDDNKTLKQEIVED